MLQFFTFLLLLLFAETAQSQVVNRYPFIQRPSQTTATIAWRRANLSTGTLYLGTAPNVWFDSISTIGLEQKHFFDLAGLQPNTEYYYKVKSIAPNDTFVSAVERFFTAPIQTEDRISFLAYGDCGYNNTIQHQVGALMEQEIVDFAMVTGDVDQSVGDDYDNLFFGVYKDMLKQDCHFTCLGNHDTYADGGATYLDAFYLFSNNPANSERYYSFEWGDAKFVCLDGNINYRVGSAQYNWMIDEFKCNTKKWLFVYFHQPPWTNAWSADYYIPFTPYFLYQGDVNMRTDLVPAFELYKVDFVVNGHSHCYQRGDMNGIQYLITGGAGASSLDNNTNSNAPNLSVEIYENHYVRFDISGDTAKYVMINANGVRRDSVMVVKSYTHYNQSITSSNITCAGTNNGQITLNVVGPKPPYTFLWNNGRTTSTITGLSAGTYTVVITDAVGCTRMDTAVIQGATPLTSQIFSSTGEYVICDGAPITLTAIGNYTTYLWSNGATTNTIQVSSPNTYSVTATNSAGCSALPSSVTVTASFAPSSVSFQYTATVLNVNFSTNSGGTYLWNFGDGTTSTLQNPTHNYPTAGIYTIQLIVTNACGSDTSMQVANIGNTSIDNIEAAKLLNLSIQPNPFNDFTTISFDNPKQEEFNLIINDVQGKTLRTYTNITANQIRIDRKDLAAGAYLYTLWSKEISVSGRLVVE